MRAFSLTDPLPTRTTVLEASAGTGKTFAIAALAVRFLAEGRAGVGDLLLVTFSRAATAELRSRVRERLQSSAAALAQAAGGVTPRDPVDRQLASVEASEIAVRAGRLAHALDHFDAATIMTTHEFCEQMIAGLGVLAPQEPQSRLIEDLLPLADEAASDVYLRRYAFDRRVPPFPWVAERRADGQTDDPGALQIARDAVTLEAVIGPDDALGSVAERVSFATEVRAEVERRKARLRVYSFDDQLTRLRDALFDPVTGELARAKLARRFPVVLIDEFQDTDPVQWQVLRSAFGRDDASTLVLIGDPKQAIYAFRGAAVHTYTAAARSASSRTTLIRNYRSDRPVVDAVGALFAGVLLGEDIDVPGVEAHHPGGRVVAAAGSPWASGVQLRALSSEEPIAPWVAARKISDDLVGVVTGLLGENPPLARPDGPLKASDIAVLVRSNGRGADVAAALARAGVPATFSGTNSVFSSPAAADWLTLLTALEQPRRPYVQRAIITDFVGATVAELATADDERWSSWSVWLHSWGRVLRRSGIPALVAAIDRDTEFTARLLAREAGERDVTDHRHLAELLHERNSAGSTNLRELIEWLLGCIGDATASSERTRRLETDESAVQIMTIHRAKGLQFPVVLLPEVSRDYLAQADVGGRVVLPMEDGRSLDVGGRAGPGREERWRRQRLDDADESLRALYVGMTRAQSHVVAWWAHHWDTAASPLHRLLHATHSGPPARPALAYNTRSLPLGGSPAALPWLADAGVSVVEVDEAQTSRAPASGLEVGELHGRAWTRTIDPHWRRTSYSGLTADAHADDAPVIADEPAEPVPVDPDPALAQPSPMAALPGGAAFGTLVHSVYETLDARGDDWRARLREQVGRAVRLWPIEGVRADALADAMAPTLETPLGTIAEGCTLRSFSPSDRLTELDFEFALDAPRATLAEIAGLLATHVPTGDDLGGYAALLGGPALTQQRLHGFLTGSIDAVLRLPSGRFLVVDYKTNRLSAPGEPPEALTLGHYTRGAMAEAMMASHYPLQALLYLVALHRFLRQRLAGYTPERHLGGAAYLFVRGMAGADTTVVDGHPTGVFAWHPSPELVQAVSRLLAGGAS